MRSVKADQFFGFNPDICGRNVEAPTKATPACTKSNSQKQQKSRDGKSVKISTGDFLSPKK